MWGHIQRSSNKMVYVRNVASKADDDDATASVCFPVSAIRGFSLVQGFFVLLGMKVLISM